MSKKIKSASEIFGEPNESKWLEKAIEWKNNASWQLHSQNIALDVLERLDELNLTQKELAHRLNVTPQVVSKWLKGKENFSLETISKLEIVLSIQLIRKEEKKLPFEVLIGKFTEDYVLSEITYSTKNLSSDSKGKVINIGSRPYETVSNVN
jgi:transcriptional regulator with XRE-family HTH domain